MGRPCCADRADAEDVASPFSEVIALGYYDGATDGFLRCGTCRAMYRFCLLDWDRGQDLRVFAVTEMSPGSWPERTEAIATEITAKADGVALLLAAEDLTRSIRVWRRWQEATAPKPAASWLEALGLTR